MRSTIACAILLAGCVGATAQDASSPHRPTPVVPIAPTLPLANADALNRQRAMDKRMDTRTRHAIGSVCQGCAGSRRPPLRDSAGTVPDPDWPVADPAEAPVD